MNYEILCLILGGLLMLVPMGVKLYDINNRPMVIRETRTINQKGEVIAVYCQYENVR